MCNWKGIILAGGSGSRLHPLTKTVSKQLLPVYDKPLIYYPLSVLMMADIKDILIISTPNDIGSYKNLFSDGKAIGLNIKYEIQKEPNGLAEAFTIGREFIGDDNVALILGDNIFYGQNFSENLQSAKNRNFGASAFAYSVKDPERFGVIEIDDSGKAISIEEKPKNPKSNYAVTGLYFYDNKVVEYAKNLKPSSRGELEITDINNIYLDKKSLKVEVLGRGFTWLDTGTHDSLLEAGQLVHAIQKSQGHSIACIEEIAFSKNWISKEDFAQQIQALSKSSYGKYLHKFNINNS